MSNRPRRLLTIAHSYVVALNRRLAHELARGSGWEVTAVSPTYFHGSRDLRPVRLEASPEEPCRLEPVPAYLTSRVHLFFYGRRLRSLLAGPWDLVHCWEEPFVVAGTQVAWWTPRRTPLVYATFQNLPKQYPPPFCWMERANLRRAAGWIAYGHTVAQTVGGRPGYSDRPTRIIAPGVDVNRFRPDSDRRAATLGKLAWPEAGPPVVGFLGRFVPEKGLPMLLRALDGVSAPWRALFVGSGPLETVLRAWAGRHGDNVRICTDVRHDEVPVYLAAMDLLCAPSQTTPGWREQFGRMLIEAFACGVPVVGSDSGEIPHVIGDAGVIVGEQDEAAWGRALEDLLQNPARRRELGSRGLERARTDFAWPVVAQRYLDFFEEVLDRRAAAPDSCLVEGGCVRGRETNVPRA